MIDTQCQTWDAVTKESGKMTVLSMVCWGCRGGREREREEEMDVDRYAVILKETFITQ